MSDIISGDKIGEITKIDSFETKEVIAEQEGKLIIIIKHVF